MWGEYVMCDWITTNLGELTSYITKGIPPKYVETAGESTVRVLNQKCNRDFQITYLESRLHDNSIKKVPVEKMLMDYDVLINSTGTGTAGRVAQIMRVIEPTTIDGHMILMRSIPEIDPLYFGYAIKACQAQIENLAEGSTGQTEINRKRLLDEIFICYPSSLKLQKYIAGLLNDLDNKILTNKKINQNLEEQLHALFDAFFTDLYFCKTTTVKQSDFGDIPSSWKVLPLGEANLDISDGNYSSKYPKQDEFLDSGIPFIRGTDFNGVSISRESMYYISSQKHEELKKGHTKRGDILITTRGDIGRIAFVPDSLVDVNINSQLVRINGSSIVPRSYLGCFLTSQRVQNDIHSLVSGSALQQLPIGKLKKVLFLMPDQDMLKRFDSIAEPFYLRMFANDEENIRLTSVRNTLLPRLMSGELDVSEIEI